MTDEIWKPVPGFEGLYEVSDMGRVRTVERTVTGFWGRGEGLKTRLVRQHEMRTYVNTARGGYRYVNLHKDGLQHMRRVAVLVAAAFLGARPEGSKCATATRSRERRSVQPAVRDAKRELRGQSSSRDAAAR